MDLISILGGAVGAVAGGVAIDLISSEITGLAPRLGAMLIGLAVRRLPKQQRARYREEWLAHQAECPGPISKILHGLGCLSSATLQPKSYASNGKVLNLSAKSGKIAVSFEVGATLQVRETPDRAALQAKDVLVAQSNEFFSAVLSPFEDLQRREDYEDLKKNPQAFAAWHERLSKPKRDS
jgi:hypothetical protein